MDEKKIDLSAAIQAAKHGNEPSVLAGRVMGGYPAPGTRRFEDFLKKVANVLHRAGECKSFIEREINAPRHVKDLSEDVVQASQKIYEAHKLLIEAEALLRSSQTTARQKTKP